MPYWSQVKVTVSLLSRPRARSWHTARKKTSAISLEMSRKSFYVQGAGAQGGPHSWSRTLVINLLTARGGGRRSHDGDLAPTAITIIAVS